MKADSTPVPRFLFMQTRQSAAAMPVNDAAAGLRQGSGRFAENLVDVRRQGYRTVYGVRDDSGRCTAWVSYPRN